MNPDRASRALAYTKQLFPQHARKELQRRFNLTDGEAHKVTLGRASDETIFRMANKLDESFALFVLGKRPLPALSMPQYLWATDTGIKEAPAGHDEFVRGFLNLPAGEDFTRYALVNLGWLAITRLSDGTQIKFGEAVEPEAARLTRDWLGVNQALRVSINGRSCADCIEAMTKLEELIGYSQAREAMLSAAWRVERKPLMAVKAPPLIAVLDEWHQTDRSPRALLRALSPHMVSAALIRVDDDQATRAYGGPNLGVPPEWLGRNVMDTEDQTYGAMVKARAMEARRLREPTFYDINCTIQGKPERYRSLMLAAENRDGSCLVGSAVERLAA